MAGVIRRERGEEQEKISLLPIPLDLSVQEPKSGGQTERCQLQEPSTKLERKLIVYPYITFTACVLFDVMRKPSAPCTLAQISGTPWCSKEHTSQTQSVPGVLCALYLCQGLLLHLSLMKVYHPAIMIVAGAFRQCKFYQQLSQNEYACIGLSLLPVARFHSVPRFISCLSYLLPADNQSVDPVSCQRPANRQGVGIDTERPLYSRGSRAFY